jgi:hypothetical protein
VFACAATSPAATSSTVVGAVVPSATFVNASGCAASASGRTDFGSTLPGSTVLTTLPCVVIADSSNDTARLRVSQSDGEGRALWRVATSHRDASFGAGGVVTFDESTAVDRFRDLARQPDGKLIAVGCAGTAMLIA